MKLEVSEVKGIEELKKALRKSADLSDVKGVVKSQGAELHQTTMRRTPVDTGAMKRANELAIEDGGFTSRVGNTMEYAPYVNFGTRFQTAQPFLTSSFLEQKIKFINELKKLMK